uniref:Biogenesis of lysosome-related organelles complex 1 subunit 1 n=1 Tax=Mesocestoides corti TaxID=53468 RepID=A0A5K3FV56_MESCO
MNSESMDMNDSGNCSAQFEAFKKVVEARSNDLMEHLEHSRASFWENLHACREYVIEQVNCLFNELESRALAEQKHTDAKTQELGLDIMNGFQKIGSCVANIDACKQSLKRLSCDIPNNES